MGISILLSASIKREGDSPTASPHSSDDIHHSDRYQAELGCGTECAKLTSQHLNCPAAHHHLGQQNVYQGAFCFPSEEEATDCQVPERRPKM
ncbi:hypothetical protein IHE44_0015020 [Lamprotornis superbus]|uniref:Uncharacterized protein n=1 Tax=Lamprotornis superbus TaxID=245042 RepID=A0A835TVK4_9PASS|nr:hypothetical protein IHE44_0015020 [Lamprotornis superbus]